MPIVPLPRSLSGLGSVGCESTAAVHFSPSFCPISGLWGCKSGKNCPRWGRFSLFDAPSPTGSYVQHVQIDYEGMRVPGAGRSAQEGSARKPQGTTTRTASMQWRLRIKALRTPMPMKAWIQASSATPEWAAKPLTVTSRSPSRHQSPNSLATETASALTAIVVPAPVQTSQPCRPVLGVGLAAGAGELGVGVFGTGRRCQRHALGAGA